MTILEATANSPAPDPALGAEAAEVPLLDVAAPGVPADDDDGVGALVEVVAALEVVETVCEYMLGAISFHDITNAYPIYKRARIGDAI
jgi:hypothetical protein